MFLVDRHAQTILSINMTVI